MLRRPPLSTSLGVGGLLLVAVAAAVTVTAAAPPPTTRSESPGPLRVLAYETAPFFSQPGGQPAGLEWEILDYFARARNRSLDVTFVERFEDLLPKLAAGEGDVVAATLTITPEREALYDFSSSYFPVRIVLVEARSGRAGSLGALAGSSLATMRGTTYEELLGAVPEATFLYGDNERDLMDLVASGEAAGAAMDSAVALTLLPTYPELHMTLSLSPEQHYGFAVAKGSPLARDLSAHIGQLKTSRIYFRLLEKYFGKAAVRMITAGKD